MRELLEHIKKEGWEFHSQSKDNLQKHYTHPHSEFMLTLTESTFKFHGWWQRIKFSTEEIVSSF